MKCDSEREHELVMMTLWDRMTAVFGHKFSSQYGTSDGQAFETWSDGLRGYNKDQVARGLNNAADPGVWQEKFPPDLNEFKRLCMTERRYAQPYHRPFSRAELEHKPQRSSRQRVVREFQVINRIIASGFTESREDAIAQLQKEASDG